MIELLTIANKDATRLSELYREFHRYPETAHNEVETNRRIRRELDKQTLNI